MPADVPSMGSAIIVVTDASAGAGEDAAAAADAAAAKGGALAKSLGLELFSFRGQTRPRYYSIGEALAAAEAALAGDSVAIPAAARGADNCGPIVIADVWDNPGGGTAGDATCV